MEEDALSFFFILILMNGKINKVLIDSAISKLPQPLFYSDSCFLSNFWVAQRRRALRVSCLDVQRGGLITAAGGQPRGSSVVNCWLHIKLSFTKYGHFH